MWNLIHYQFLVSIDFTGLLSVLTFEKEGLPSNLGNSIKVASASVRGITVRSMRKYEEKRDR